MLRFVFVCLCVCLETVLAAQSIGHVPLKPKELSHKEGCYIKEIKDVIPYGEKTTPIGKSCINIVCGKAHIKYQSCGSVAFNPNESTLTDEDLTKPYPDCCPKLKPKEKKE